MYICISGVNVYNQLFMRTVLDESRAQCDSVREIPIYNIFSNFDINLNSIRLVENEVSYKRVILYILNRATSIIFGRQWTDSKIKFILKWNFGRKAHVLQILLAIISLTLGVFRSLLLLLPPKMNQKHRRIIRVKYELDRTMEKFVLNVLKFSM